MRYNIYAPGVQLHGEVAWLGRHKFIGAARFLPDGSFVIVPGFENGVHLFSTTGRFLRSWNSDEIGADTDCSGMSADEEEELSSKPAAWQGWLNRHRTVDDVLPLPQGPGLLVRSWGEDGQAHWQLKILKGSRVETWTVPITGPRPTDRLRGDVRAGKIAFLLSASGFNGPPMSSDPKGEIVLTEVPTE